MQNKLIKSPLKWAGGKSAIVPRILDIWNKANSKGITRYVDMFCGSCVIPLNIQANSHTSPISIHINDANRQLIKFWRWVQQNGQIEKTLINSEFYYQKYRDEYNETGSPELFYYLNRTCFNGLYRVNSKGIFNVPYCKSPNRPIVTNFSDIKAIIKGWSITDYDFRRCFFDLELESKSQTRSLYFVDPPYVDGFTSYTDAKFSWDDQVDLVQRLSQAVDKGSIAVATNKATDSIIKLYESYGFDIEIIEMSRKISCNGSRKPVKEIFATKGVNKIWE